MKKEKRPPGKKAQARKAAVKVDVPENEAVLNINSEQRRDMIAETAYLIAKERDFQGESALDDWLQAEKDIDVRLATGRPPSDQG